jgi:hypothetical protein
MVLVDVVWVVAVVWEVVMLVGFIRDRHVSGKAGNPQLP